MTTLKLPGSIVSIHWLATHLGHPKLIVLDASLKPITATTETKPSDAELQIPTSRIFDFDKKICDRNSTLPHMMPSAELFTQEVRALGICQDSFIVIYDRTGVYSSPRAWWMFKAMGHEHVAVLDGGMPAWMNAGMTCQPGSNQSPAAGDFIATPNPTLFCDAKQVSAALNNKDFAIIDARSEKRFLGKEPEPRSGLRAGHMPNALNLPFAAVQKEGHIREVNELKTIFASIVNPQQRLIFSCGSGVTACILALAARLAGYRNISVYDGSWSEWGQPSSRPVVTV